MADNTGELKVVLKDREIRNLIHKYVEEVDSEVIWKFINTNSMIFFLIKRITNVQV